MNRVDRLFGILTLLQSRKYVPAEKIAGRFGISVRTVYRDIKALGEQGIPISFEQHKGYFVVPGYFLPPVSFSSEEAAALLLMESMVRGFADASIHTHYAAALNKIRAVLRTPEKEKLELLGQHIRFQIPASFTPGPAYLSGIQTAITSRTVVELEYRNNRQETSKRKAEPLGLVFYAFGWHLVAWCHLRGAYRDFKVSRILSIRNTGQPFTRQDHMTLTDYMKSLPVDY